MRRRGGRANGAPEDPRARERAGERAGWRGVVPHILLLWQDEQLVLERAEPRAASALTDSATLPLEGAMTLGLGLPFLPSVKRKVFVSYHHDRDQYYYDQFVSAFDEFWDVVTDGSLDRALDSDDADYVMRRIRERYVTGTSCTLVFCGVETPLRKYVDWEIKATLDKQHGLVGVWLPGTPQGANGGVSKPDRLQDNVDSGYAVWTDWLSVTSSPQSLLAAIEDANARAKYLIANSRPMRRRNG